jgi:hypothetical protein
MDLPHAREIGYPTLNNHSQFRAQQWLLGVLHTPLTTYGAEKRVKRSFDLINAVACREKELMALHVRKRQRSHYLFQERLRRKTFPAF